MSVPPAGQGPSDPKVPQDGRQPLQAEELPVVGYASVVLHRASSRFAGIRPLYAWLLLGLVVGLSVYGVYVHTRTQTLTIRAEDLNQTDFALYQRIVDRVHAGEGYYQAAGTELRASGFPVRPFLTWRLPTAARFMALFPNTHVCRLVIAAIVLTALWFWIGNLRPDGAFWPILGGVLLLTVFIAPLAIEVWGWAHDLKPDASLQSILAGIVLFSCLGGVVLILLWLYIRRVKEDGPLWMPIVVGTMLLLSMIAGVGGPSPLHHETWSGLCITLSLALYGRGYWQMSVVAGLLALFFRELALPFVVVMLTMACWQRRKGEALAWLVGLVAFAAFLGFHAWMVNRQLTAADVSVGPGWLHLGGWPFVIKTARSNVIFLALPSWVAGLLLPFLLLGLAGWSSQVGTRAALTVGMYVVAFLFAGRLYHAYWGLMYSSLLPLGFVFAPRALGDLLRGIRPKRVPEPQQAQCVERAQ